MMQNILGLSGLFFTSFLFCPVDHIAMHINKVDNQELFYIRQLADQYPKEKIVITIQAELPFKLEVIQKETISFLGIIYKKINVLNQYLQNYSTTNIFSCFLGSGLAYYSTIFYFIYRVYTVAKKLRTILKLFNFVQKQNDDIIGLTEKMFKNNNVSSIDYYDYQILKLYKKVNYFLKKTYCRKFFPQDLELDTFIETVLVNYC